jgi:tripartite-type tricarboxylate transporter receptor subunit TctC
MGMRQRLGLCRRAAAEWRPTKPVEIIVGTPSGGPLDETARLLEALLEKRNLGVPVSVINKPGDGHYVSMALTNPSSCSMKTRISKRCSPSSATQKNE